MTHEYQDTLILNRLNGGRLTVHNGHLVDGEAIIVVRYSSYDKCAANRLGAGRGDPAVSRRPRPERSTQAPHVRALIGFGVGRVRRFRASSAGCGDRLL